jgi:hypothetical protein
MRRSSKKIGHVTVDKKLLLEEQALIDMVAANHVCHILKPLRPPRRRGGLEEGLRV